jgi:hypothetical protein
MPLLAMLLAMSAPTRVGEEFHAFYSVNIVRSRAGQVTCSYLINTTVGGVRAVEECGFLSGSGAAAAMRRIGGDAALTLVFRTIPRGERPAALDERPFGEPIYDSAAEIEVAPDGRVTDCRMTRDQWLRQLPAVRVPTLCLVHAPGGRSRFEPASDQAGPRFASLTMRVYLRVRTAGRR